MKFTSFDWRRALVYTHRWLGIAGGLLVVLWFGSGVVMVYARMPTLESEERLTRMPELDLTEVRVPPGEAARVVGASSLEMRMGMLAGRPVYRFGARAIYADLGGPVENLSADQAMDVLRRFVPEHAGSLDYDMLLTAPDQWTLQNRALLPLHRIALGDAEDTRLYVSERSGEVVMKTTRSGRRWAYAGAVLHWLYFTPFRAHTSLWNQTIIWLSVLGCLVTLSGLVWGVWRFSWWGGGQADSARSPYAGLLHWHHYAGLLFGLFTFTWLLSGGLSMDPWSWHPGTAATSAQRTGVSGGSLRVDEPTAEQVRNGAAVLAATRPIKELGVTRLQGELYLSATGANPGEGPLHVSVISPEMGVLERFDEADLLEAARSAMPGVEVEDEVWLDEYDDYYYGRPGNEPVLPILRVRYADAQRTWLYFDPARGAIARKEERLTRLNRWLYRGFHSLDFPFLYSRRPLWDIVVIILSLGGLALAGTTLLPGWKRLIRHARRLAGG